MRTVIFCSAVMAALALGAPKSFAQSKMGPAGNGSQSSSGAPAPIDDNNYQSCSQGDQPLLADYPPTNKGDYGTYLHYSIIMQHGEKNLLAWGTIDQCDDERLRRVLRVAKPFDNFVLYSNGGDLDEAFAMGRTLRNFGATTLVEHDSFCISACNFVYMGGAIRMIEPEASFQVHMFDDDAADRLKALMINPPKNLDDFIREFPFRSDLTQSAVDAAVKQKNSDNAGLVDDLDAIDGLEDTEMASSGSSQTAGSSTDSMSQQIEPVDTSCEVLLNETFDRGNASAVQEVQFHRACIGQLQKPYTALDYLRDQATDEDVKSEQQQVAKAAAEIAAYLQEMGISTRFLTEFASIPNSQPKELSIDELRDLFVVNSD